MRIPFARLWAESVRTAERDVKSGKAFMPKGLVRATVKKKADPRSPDKR